MPATSPVMASVSRYFFVLLAISCILNILSEQYWKQAKWAEHSTV